MEQAIKHLASVAQQMETIAREIASASKAMSRPAETLAQAKKRQKKATTQASKVAKMAKRIQVKLDESTHGAKVFVARAQILKQLTKTKTKRSKKVQGQARRSRK